MRRICIDKPQTDVSGALLCIVDLHALRRPSPASCTLPSSCSFCNKAAAWGSDPQDTTY